MLRLSLLSGGLLCIAVAAVLGAASPSAMTDAQKRKAYQPYVAAAADCLARVIVETPAAVQHARKGAWMDAAGRHCDPVVGRMIFARNELYGPSSNRDVLGEPFATDVAGALAARLEPAVHQVTAETDPVPTVVARMTAPSK